MLVRLGEMGNGTYRICAVSRCRPYPVGPTRPSDAADVGGPLYQIISMEYKSVEMQQKAPH